MTETAALAAGKEFTNTFTYCLKLIYNEGEGGEQILNLTDLWTEELPLNISETRTNNLRKYAFASSGLDGGTENDLIEFDVSLICSTWDNRYAEKQIRQIKEFFAVAPSKMVNVLWVDSAGDRTGYVARINSCKLSDIRLSRFRPKFSPATINLSFQSLSTEVDYDEPGDSASAAPNIYASDRFRSATNDGSYVITVVNDVTGNTLAAIDDQGFLHLRGGVREYNLY